MAGHISRMPLTAVLLFATNSVLAEAPAKSDDRLGTILEEWQRQSATWKSLDVRYSNQIRSPGWPDRASIGRVILLRGGRALVDSVERNPSGKPIRTQRMIWTDEESHLLQMEAKSDLVWERASADRGRLPSVLALPFLWEVGVAKLKARFEVELVKEGAKTWTLSFAPLTKSGLKYFSKAYLQLDRETCLPREYVLVTGHGRSNHCKVTEIRRDQSSPQDVLNVPDTDGWNVNKNYDPNDYLWKTWGSDSDLLP